MTLSIGALDACISALPVLHQFLVIDRSQPTRFVGREWQLQMPSVRSEFEAMTSEDRLKEVAASLAIEAERHAAILAPQEWHQGCRLQCLRHLLVLLQPAGA